MQYKYGGVKHETDDIHREETGKNFKSYSKWSN